MIKVSASDDGDNLVPQVLYKTVEIFGLYVLSWRFTWGKYVQWLCILFHNEMLLIYRKFSNASYVTEKKIISIEMIQVWFIKSAYSNILQPEDTELKTTFTSSKVCPIHSTLEFVLNIWRFKNSWLMTIKMQRVLNTKHLIFLGSGVGQYSNLVSSQDLGLFSA